MGRRRWRDFYCGIPGNKNRGFKLGVDIRGKVFDPTVDDHLHTPETLSKARIFIGRRFPDLQNAPVAENRVCPYESSPDGNFVFDLLSEATNAFVLRADPGTDLNTVPH